MQCHCPGCSCITNLHLININTSPALTLEMAPHQSPVPCIATIDLIYLGADKVVERLPIERKHVVDVETGMEHIEILLHRGNLFLFLVIS